MEKFRSIVEHYFKLEKTVNEVHFELLKGYGEEAPAIRTLQRWFKLLKNGESHIIHKKGAGAPRLEIDTELLVLVNQNPLASSRSLANALGISNKTVTNRLKELNYSN